MAENDDVLLVERAARVAVLTMNRPERRNALSVTLRRRLRATIKELEADDGVDVVILTGADPAFCAGIDLTELASGEARLADDAAAEPSRHRGPLGPHAKPIIGAVNGVAVTGGLELALACDFLIASDRARFADTHARVGILPGWGLTVLLPEAVGLRRAREMSATGNFIDAQVALEWGLVNHVVTHGELLEASRSLAAAIVSNDQAALRALYLTYERVADVPGAQGWELEARSHGDWTRAHLSQQGTAERLRAVIDRGRDQVAER